MSQTRDIGIQHTDKAGVLSISAIPKGRVNRPFSWSKLLKPGPFCPGRPVIEEWDQAGQRGMGAYQGVAKDRPARAPTSCAGLSGRDRLGKQAIK